MSEVTEVADLVYPLSSITSTSSTTSITSQKTKRRPFQAGVLFFLRAAYLPGRIVKPRPNCVSPSSMNTLRMPRFTPMPLAKASPTPPPTRKR